jgi:hypothetical protein
MVFHMNRLWHLTLQSLPLTLRTTRSDIQKLYIVITWNVCVLYGSQKKQQIFLHNIKVLALYKRGGEYLQRGPYWVLI